MLTLGSLSTGSRTGATMLIALVVSLHLHQAARDGADVAVLLPLLVLIQGVMPGTLGTIKMMLNPAYVIQGAVVRPGGGAGRIADLGPALARWSATAAVRLGLRHAIADPNAGRDSDQQILDDQWLGSLLEIGAVGVLALLWLFAGRSGV